MRALDQRRSSTHPTRPWVGPDLRAGRWHSQVLAGRSEIGPYLKAKLP